MGNRDLPPPPEPAAGEENSKEEVQPAAPVKSGVEVIAEGPGFYKNSRKKRGDRFTVPSLDKVGSWMKCVDKKAHAEVQKMLKAKKDKARAEQK